MISLFWVRLAHSLKLAGASSVLHWEWVLSREARRELRSPQTRMIGSIATFPERYGDNLIQVAFDILHHKPVQPAIYAQVQILTPQNIEQFYPSTLFADADKEQ